MAKLIIAHDDGTVIETITVQDDPMEFTKFIETQIEENYDQEFYKIS